MRIVEAGGRTALRASGGAGGMALACGVVITMCAQSTKQSPDATIAWVARLQHGVVAREQLLQTGVTTAQIALRLRDGRLRTIHRGVYLVGPVPTDLAYSQAALLACGSDAVLSHRSAAAIWGLLPYPSKAYPWVTVPSSQHVVRPRIVVRRRSLHRRDIRTRERLRLVSPPRAVLDCAEVLDDPYELEAMVAEAAFRGLASDAEVREQVRRSARRPGVPHVRKILDIEGGPQRTRSGGERWFLALLRNRGFSRFEFNARVHGYEVDCLWRQLGFAVELDGWDGHSSRIAFERDRVKWAHLQANGIDVMPIATRSAQRDEAGTLMRLRQTLARLQNRPTR